MLGCARRAMDMTVDNAKRRHQFGRPIGMFQAVQHHSADMRMDVESASLLVWSALWRAAHAHPFTRHALMAAWHTGEAAERVTKTAVQLHGGIGFMKEYPLHHFYRRAKAHKLRLGTLATCSPNSATRSSPTPSGTSTASSPPGPRPSTTMRIRRNTA
ncbi:acyl-CoA dehydrogenase family protein [Thermocatellispora tengchongensis]|uniref:acyl-CoA dehydrogenase family protein n=1 Tax=Thermocatellispora tengchongensis TaxID=1073253 RepID=UPI0036413DE4